MTTVLHPMLISSKWMTYWSAFWKKKNSRATPGALPRVPSRRRGLRRASQPRDTETPSARRWFPGRREAKTPLKYGAHLPFTGDHLLFRKSPSLVPLSLPGAVFFDSLFLSHMSLHPLPAVLRVCVSSSWLEYPKMFVVSAWVAFPLGSRSLKLKYQ